MTDTERIALLEQRVEKLETQLVEFAALVESFTDSTMTIATALLKVQGAVQ